MALAYARTPQEIIDSVCAALVEEPPYVLAFIGFAQEKEGKPIKIVGAAGPARAYADGLNLSWSENVPEGRGPTGRAIRSGKPYILRDSHTDPAFAHWKERGAQYGIRSSVTVPFSRGGKTDGVCCVYASQPEAFGPEELELFGNLGNAIGFAVAAFQDRARLDMQTLRLERLIDSAHSPILSIDENGQIALFNAAAEAAFGYAGSEVLGKSLAFLIPEEMGLSDGAQVAGGETSPTREVFGRKKDGTDFPIEVAMTRVDTVEGPFATAIIRDLSERKAFEQRLVQSAKMEALGQLAGGIAHDFNNLLAIILANVDLVADALPANSRAFADLDRVRRTSQRGVDLIGRMMRFARKKQAVAVRINAATALEDLTTILRRTLGRGIAISLACDDADLFIAADPALFETSILNLAFNARDAMPDGGELEFTLLRTGRTFVEIRVRDTGSGIPLEIQERIFEPFYTTKAAGKGTGLGLATVRNFVAEAGGRIQVDSIPGMGTTFTLRFPEAP